MNLSSLYDINDTFWELDEKEQNEILSNILDYANKKGKSSFETEVTKLFNLEEDDSPITLVYQALSTDCPDWSLFFKNEIIRGFEFAKKSSSRKVIFNNINETSYASNSEIDSKVRGEIVDYLEQQLETQDIRILYESIGLIETWILKEPKRFQSSIKKLQEFLRHDHWRIRNIAHICLVSFNAVPQNYNPSIMDRIRISLFSNSEF